MPLGRRGGRPGLIGTAARTAVVVGTANAVSNKQQTRYAQQQAAQVPPPVAPAQPPVEPAAATATGGGDLIAQLQQLAQLQAAGVLTAEEFAAAKAKLLA